MKNLVLALAVMMTVPALAQSGDVGSTSNTRTCSSRLRSLTNMAQEVGRVEKRVTRPTYTDSSRRASHAKYLGTLHRDLENRTLALRDRCMAGNALTCSESLESLVTQSRQLGRYIQARVSGTAAANVRSSIANHRSIVSGCMIQEEAEENSTSGTTSSGSNNSRQQSTESSGSPGRAN